MRVRSVTGWLVISFCPIAQSGSRDAAPVSVADVGALLAGRYDNAAQLDLNKPATGDPPLQHVTVTIEPTQRAEWEIWRIHMDVDPAVASAAGSETSLTALWAMNIVRRAAGEPLGLIPYTLKPSVSDSSVNAAAFDQAQWLSLEACALGGDFTKSRAVAQAPTDEMCVAETMGLGGKRAFLPTWIERDGDRLGVELIYFGKPWRVDARRVKAE
jgi:hypothetical protein